jgi:hypothetical protein
MTASAFGLTAPLRHRGSQGKYGKYRFRNVIFLTLGLAGSVHFSPPDQEIRNQAGRERLIDTI